MANKKKLFNPLDGHNTRMIKLILHSNDLPRIDTSDPEQVKKRISEYFDFCEEYNLFPSISGLANWIGVHRDTLHSWKTGEMRKNTHQKIINDAYSVIEEMIVAMLLENKIVAPVGIFWLKCLFGYRDRFDIGIGAGTVDRPRPFDSMPNAELARKSFASAEYITLCPDKPDHQRAGYRSDQCERNTD